MKITVNSEKIIDCSPKFKIGDIVMAKARDGYIIDTVVCISITKQGEISYQLKNHGSTTEDMAELFK